MPMIQGYVRKMSHKGISPVSYFWETANYNEADKKDLTAKESTSTNPVESWIGKKLHFLQMMKFGVCIVAKKLRSRLAKVIVLLVLQTSQKTIFVF